MNATDGKDNDRWVGSEEIHEIAEAAISAILAACCDFWQMPRFCNAAVNVICAIVQELVITHTN